MSHTLHRFYLDMNLKEKGVFEIHDKEFSDQIRKVLRLKTGSEVFIFNNEGIELKVLIKEFGKNTVTVEFLESIKRNTELEREIWVYQSIPNRMPKFEDLLIKCTELGVKSFVPILTSRVQVPFLKKRDRLEKIIKESCEQCERTVLPVLLEEMSFNDILKSPPEGENILLYARAPESNINLLKSVLNENKSERINIFIGPEGGFTDDEVNHAEKAGFLIIKFGERILKTQTAAPAIIAAINFYDLD